MVSTQNVDALIAEAVRTKDTATLSAALRALDRREVFYRAVVTPTADGQRVSAPLVRLDDGSHALVVFTAKTHPDLPRKFGGAPWRHVVAMAAQLPAADWLIVSTTGGDWLPFSRSQISVIRTDLDGAAAPAGSEDPGNAGVGVGGYDIGALITETRSAHAEDLLDRLLASLAGRELFIRLSADRVEDGRPTLMTSTVGDVSGLAQVYTSRKRPGITYGGMTWDDIVALVSESPELAGVHLVNDDDDWIIVGRNEITRSAPEITAEGQQQ